MPPETNKEAFNMKKEFDLKVELRSFYEALIEECSRIKNYENALHYCNRALVNYPLDVDLLYTKVLLLYKNKMFIEALEGLELVNKCDVNHLYEKDTEILFYTIRSILLFL
jgi:tetratricopeptide (TPR) repeat protein